jgi:hypothetical protein
LNEEFSLEAAGSFVFVFAAGATCEERVYFVDKDYAGGEGFGEGKERSDQFF